MVKEEMVALDFLKKGLPAIDIQFFNVKSRGIYF